MLLLAILSEPKNPVSCRCSRKRPKKRNPAKPPELGNLLLGHGGEPYITTVAPSSYKTNAPLATNRFFFKIFNRIITFCLAGCPGDSFGAYDPEGWRVLLSFVRDGCSQVPLVFQRGSHPR